MKTLIALLALVSVPAHADWWKELKPANVICAGKASGSDHFHLVIEYVSQGKTRVSYTIDEAEVTPYTFEAGQFGVGDEGNIYIQQVVNEQKYNLVLAGPGVNQLYKDAQKNQESKGSYTLTGRLTLGYEQLDGAAVSCSAKFAR